MTVLSDFRTQFPEFRNALDSLVQANLDAASLEIDPLVWKLKAQQGQMLLAAHKLALSPFGQAARAVDKADGTMYFKHYSELRLQVSCAWSKCGGLIQT